MIKETASKSIESSVITEMRVENEIIRQALEEQIKRLQRDVITKLEVMKSKLVDHQYSNIKYFDKILEERHKDVLRCINEYEKTKELYVKFGGTLQ